MTPRFTADQRRAIQTLEGSVAISAGAGSGKTTVLAHRFAHAIAEGIESGSVPVDGVLTITFTSKAAAEVGERVRRVVGQSVSVEAGREVESAWISTIHSLCTRLLRRHLVESGLSPAFRTADEATAKAFSSDAYEHAVFDLVGRDESVALLVDSFGASALRSMVVTCHDQIRAMGLDPEATQVGVDPAGLDRFKAVTVRMAREYEDAIAQVRDTPGALRARAYLAEWTAFLHECDTTTEGGAQAVGQLCDDYKLTAPGGTRPFSDQLRKQIEETLRCYRALELKEVIAGLQTLIARYASAYRALKLQKGVLDFDDLQERAVAMLERDPRIAERYRTQFKLVMVDEFQDTNELQMRVLGQLVDGNLCIVGDERQSIYGWRYADVSIFRRLVAQADTPIPLKANFRSHPQVLDFVNELFVQPHLFGSGFMQLVPGREEQVLFPLADEAPRVECLLVDFKKPTKAADAVQVEATAIASRAAELVASGVAQGDIAVIVRSGTYASVYAQAFEDAGLSVALSAGSALFDTPEVDHLIEMLRALVVPADDEALLALLAGPMVAVSDDALIALRRAAGKDRLWTGLKACVEGQAEDLTPEDLSALSRCRDVIDYFGAAYGSMRLSDVVRQVCEAFDYDVTLHVCGVEGVRAWANVLKIARYADSFEAAESNDPARFVEYLALCREHTNDNPAPAEAGGQSVRVLTIHAAKGLEFPVVFVAGLRNTKYKEPDAILVEAADSAGVRVPRAAVRMPEKVFGRATTPDYNRLRQEAIDAQQEEEKRALYVACTRAKELLVLSAARDLSKEASEGSCLIDWVREGLTSEQDGVTRVGNVPVNVTVLEAQPAEESVDSGGDRPWLADEPLVAGEFEPPSRPSAPRVPSTVSYSSLHLYESCPLAFHARYVLRMQSFDENARFASTGLGSAVHSWLQAWASGAELTETREAALALRYELGETLQSRLAVATRRFVTSALAERACRADRLIPEAPIRVALGETMLTGAIDLVAWEGESVLVVDYKTGEAPNSDSDRLPGYELQARCYALAALEAGAKTAEVHFAFVEHDVPDLVYGFDRKAVEPLRDHLRSRVERMGTEPLTHLPTFDPHACGDCPALNTLCPVEKPAWAARG